MLERYGWQSFFADAFAPFGERGLIPGRVAVEHRALFVLYTEAGERKATVAGRLLRGKESAIDRPAVGDWVALRAPADSGRAVIEAVLPRRSAFIRKRVGRTSAEQVVAANIDTVLVVTAIGRDLSSRRLERYLSMAWESGAQPVIVINKTDLEEDASETELALGEAGLGAPTHRVCALTGDGIGALESYLAPGRTAALLGSSGVGKSTLVNALTGSTRQSVADVRADGKGRHTTTRRELVILPGGALLIDTPGMRELALLESDDGLATAFPDVNAIAERCHFRDCTHAGEPGCAVEAAIAAGELSVERVESYRKLVSEARHAAARTDERLRGERRRHDRVSAKAFNNRLRSKYGDR